jgi:hypothetical protein
MVGILCVSMAIILLTTLLKLRNCEEVMNNDKNYLVVGSIDFFYGVGNTLIFYPSPFLFALIVGREILIADNSDIGLMCRILTCGFRYLSQVASDFPDETVHMYKPPSMREHFTETPLLYRFITVAYRGQKTDWFMW